MLLATLLSTLLSMLLSMPLSMLLSTLLSTPLSMLLFTVQWWLSPSAMVSLPPSLPSSHSHNSKQVLASSKYWTADS